MSTKKNTFENFFSAEKMNEMFSNFQTPMMNIDAVLDLLLLKQRPWQKGLILVASDIGPLKI